MTHVLDALGRIKEYWGSLALADLDDYAQGRVIRGGAVAWEAYAAETLGAVLIGDGTDVVSDTTPTLVGLLTLNAGLEFGGGAGVNVITIPDAIANALEVVDGTTGDEYLGFKTSVQKEVVFNEDGVDIDFRIEAAGGLTNALFFQGSDGAITLGGPSITLPFNWWIGIGPALERIVFDAGGGDIAVMGANFGVGTLVPGRDVDVAGDIRLSGILDQNTVAGQLIIRQGHAGVAGGVSIQGGDAWNTGAYMEFWGENQAALPGYADIMHGGSGAPASLLRLGYYDGIGPSYDVILNPTGHFYPGSNKAQDFGLAGSRWREIFCSLALNTGTSRLVPVQKNCAVDGTQLVRSTGGLRVTGEDSDFLLAFCPLCGTVAMEELRHRTATATRSAPKVVLVGMEVLKNSGNTKSVVVNFRYGDDMEGETGIQKAPHNSTTLSDDELAAFLGMADDKERRAFLLELGRIEWDALEKMKVIEPELDNEQVQIAALIRDLIGIDLSKEIAVN